MKVAKPSSIDEYISSFPEGTQKVLQEVRDRIRKVAPSAEEKISYGIPTFTQEGSYLIYFAGYKKHISIYPAPRENTAFKKELSCYKGGKGTLQCLLDKPIPFDLIARIVRFRMKEVFKGSKKTELTRLNGNKKRSIGRPS